MLFLNFHFVFLVGDSIVSLPIEKVSNCALHESSNFPLWELGKLTEPEKIKAQ